MRQSFSTQPTLFSGHELMSHPALQGLDDVEAVINWPRLASLLGDDGAKQQTGRPGYPALTLFRALLLGLWYDLSDVALSSQLARDLLFRKFCRLELDQAVPEASTLGRFRQHLGGRLQACLDEVLAMLEEARVVLAEGRIAIVDATVVEAAQSGVRKPDPEAGARVKINVKGKLQAVWGYQAVVNADEDGFIRRVVVSPGNEAEVESLSQVIVGDETELYADSAYIGPRTRELLKRHRMRDRVQTRGARGHPLSAAAKARNIEIGVTRGRVEAIFGHWKRHWRLGRSRFMGRARTATHLSLAAIGWNLWKAARWQRRFA